MSPHVFLVASEESGDRLGAALIAAIKRRAPDARFSGVGGAHMAEEGFQSLLPLGDMAIVGLAGIASSLPKILRRIRETADAVVAARPDVLVIIDSPEFTHRVARRVRKIAPQIPIIDYVCPTVWAWRPGRAPAMRGYIDHVLSILPFEPAVLKRLHGPSCTYVGHPLSERLGVIRPNADEARRRLADPPLLVVLPGSRPSELNLLAPVFGECAALIADRVGAVDVVVPAVPRLAAAVAAAVSTWRVPARIVIEPADKDLAFRTARAALTKSGTSTFELALAGIPMIGAYKVPFIESIVGRLLITSASVIMTNLILGENVVPEFLQGDCNPQSLSGALLPLLSDTPERRRQIEAFARLDGIMEIANGAPSDRAAAVVLNCMAGLNHRTSESVALDTPKA